MIELGKVQTLTVQREKDFGVYMGEPGDEKRAVLLPRKQVPEGTKVGDSLEVFVYKDSEDRLIATSGKPRLQVGETAVLPVKDVVKIGAFLLRSRITRYAPVRNAWWLSTSTRAGVWLLP